MLHCTGDPPCRELPLRAEASRYLLRLGVWAAEGFENEHPNFDLSESRRSDFLDGAKGSGTPEITTFCDLGLLPPRLLGGSGVFRSAFLALEKDIP